jgi:CubicO group peptidase (beta-lactamase class C family)
LLEPLSITDVEWTSFPSGDVRGHGGLRRRPRDLAKLGQLVLDRGMWQGKQIISADWIAESTSPQINGESIFFYGYNGGWGAFWSSAGKSAGLPVSVMVGSVSMSCLTWTLLSL